MNSTGRLFTFGCSMTSYNWPTWADILGKEWKSFENWGQRAAGNNFIFNSVIECDSRNNFTPDDTILIMWSGPARIDYYQYNHWGHMVNQFCRDRPDLPLSCPDGYEIISYALFHALDKYLDSKKLNYKFLSFLNYDKQSRAGLVYSDVLSKINLIKFDLKSKNVKQYEKLHEVKVFYDGVSGKDWPPLSEILDGSFVAANDKIQAEVTDFVSKIKSNSHHYRLVAHNRMDSHPLPMEHLLAIKQISPFTNLKDSTIEWTKDIDEKIQKGLYYEFDKHLPSIRL